MAQLWLTYDEMAQWFGVSATAARTGAIESGWARLKGRDGVTHVRLPPALAADYLAGLATTASMERQTDAMVSSLRAISRVAEQPAPTAKRVA